MSESLSNPARAVATAIARQQAAADSLRQAMEGLLEPAGLAIVTMNPSLDGSWILQVRAKDATAAAGAASESSRKPALSLPATPAQARPPRVRRKGPGAVDSSIPDSTNSLVAEDADIGADLSTSLPALGLPTPGEAESAVVSEASPASGPAKAPELSTYVRPIAPGVTIEDVSNMSSEVTEGYRVPNLGRKRDNPLRARETDPRVRAQQLARTLVGEIIVYRRLEHEAALAQGLPALRVALKGDILRAHAQFMHDVEAALGDEREAIFLDAVNAIIGRGQPVLPMP